MLPEQTLVIPVDGMDQMKFTMPSPKRFKGYLKATEKMDADDSEFLPSGHSHNELDQRFSTVAGVILSAPVLEHMEEFAEWMRKEVAPVRVPRRNVGLPAVAPPY